MAGFGPAGGFGGGGGPFGGPRAAPGLPFAGIPPELAELAEAILEREPEHPEPVVDYDPAAVDGAPFTLRRFLSPHRGALAVAVVLVVLETLAIQAGPLLTKIGIDRGIVGRSRGWLVAAASAYLVSVVLGAVASGVRVSWTGRVGERLMYELRIRVFSHLQRLSLDFYTREKAGRIMTRMTSDIEALTALFQDGLVNLFVQVLTLVVISAVLFTLNPTLAAVTIGAVVPAMLAFTIWFRNASDRGYAVVRDRIADVLADLQENLAGMRVVATCNRRLHNAVHHRNVVGAHRDANLSTAVVGGVYGSAAEVLSVGGQVVVLVVGGHMVLDGSLTVGELTAFVLYLASFFAPIQQLVQLYNVYQQGQAAVAKLRDLLATTPSVLERPGAGELPPVEGEIVLDGVTFGYEPGTPVLHDVSLRIPAGATFAFVGETGAGKSTIAKLVTRFYDPQAGRVLIDGHDLRDVTLESLRRQLGVVPQEPFLFHGSVRENVAFARPGADDDAVWEACRAVGVDDVVARLADGLDTPCHERGATLSSGERQLLALARAFLARPRVVVLDEATSRLDLRSEARIEHALDVLLEGRTAIVIAHRLTTAMRADTIAVVHDGRVVEQGSHDELVASGGRYAEMYRVWVEHSEHAPAS